ncbi:hypothetical protein NMY22_g5947 [Coprinellus aureogranulatus]|nr:hypothetical protein NMY22_g5947 [Coprinellus aureogranulatus]
MLRAAFRTATAATTTRPWASTARPVVARWSRYNSSVPSGEAGPSKLSEKEPPKPAETKPVEAVAESSALSDKQVDAQLNDALLEALQEMELEAKQEETPLTVKDLEGPVFKALPPTNPKYSPENLPLPPTPERINSSSEEEWHASLIHGRSSLDPYSHKPIYRIPAASLHLRSHHPKLLDFFCHFAGHAAASLGIPISKVVHLPTQRSLWTVPRSPFAHKKSQENFERRTHKRAIKAWDTDPEVLDRWFQYIRQHAMGGVGMRAIRWDRAPVGVGARQARQAVVTPQVQVKQLAEKIVREEGKKVGTVEAA